MFISKLDNILLKDLFTKFETQVIYVDNILMMYDRSIKMEDVLSIFNNAYDGLPLTFQTPVFKEWIMEP